MSENNVLDATNAWIQPIPENWQYYRLSDLLAHTVDNRGKTPPTVDIGIPLIATYNISSDHLYPTDGNLRYVSQETYDTWFRSHPEPDDIIITNKGEYRGTVCLVPDPADFCMAQDMIALRVNRQIVHPYYLLAVLRSDFFRQQVDAFTVSSAIPHLRKTDFDRLIIPVPPLSEQVFIGKIYVDFSKKIELSRRMNATLEATARAIFQSWFVDFDPVQAKARGEQPSGMDAATAALFPSRFVDSTLGPIPEGWKIEPTEKFCQSVRDGTHNSPKPQETGKYLITSRHILGSEVDIANAYKVSPDDFEEINRRSKVDQWDVLITMIGTVGESFLVRENPDFAIKNIGLFKNKDRVSGEWLYLYLNTSSAKQIIKTLQAGTTQAYVSLGQLRQLLLPAPPVQVLHAFGEAIIPISDKITHNLIENRSLAETRNALLPKLLSGEVRIEDVQQ